MTQPEPAQPQRVLVPALVGLDVADAHQMALHAGLLAVGPDLDTPPPIAGVVIRQDPQAGRQIPAASAVTIWVRSDPPDDTDDDQGGGGGGGGMPDPTDPARVTPAGSKPVEA